MNFSHGYPTRYKVRDCVGGVGKISNHKVKGEIQVGVKRFPPTYESHQTHVEISPNVREVSKIQGERQVDMWRFPSMYGSQMS